MCECRLVYVHLFVSKVRIEKSKVLSGVHSLMVVKTRHLTRC